MCHLNRNHLHINILQQCSIVAMVAHKAAFYARKVERLVILVVVILSAEVFIPVAGHILPDFIIILPSNYLPLAG